MRNAACRSACSTESRDAGGRDTKEGTCASAHIGVLYIRATLPAAVSTGEPLMAIAIADLLRPSETALRVRVLRGSALAPRQTELGAGGGGGAWVVGGGRPDPRAQ